MTFDDWFLGSKNEILKMHKNLWSGTDEHFVVFAPVGGFSNAYYQTSSEYSITPTLNEVVDFTDGTVYESSKGVVNKVRACRVFMASVGAYSLRSTGPAGGLIFYITGTTYYEAAPTDQANTRWSNITTAIGTTSYLIGEGQNNTNEIIAQASHTDSAAKVCDDLVIITSSVVRCVGNAARYRFYLTIGSSVTEVFPLNFRESLLTDEQEKGEVFYRRRYSGTLTFTNGNGDDDFDLLYLVETVSPCSKILILIERNDVYYWDGYFSTTDGAWDLDKCTFEVQPLANDDYAAIYDVADIQHNILTMDDPATGIAYLPVTVTAFVSGDTNFDPAVDYTRNRWLVDVLEYMCDAVMSGATYSSDFFTAVNNPATLNPNKLLYLTIAQKSDIKRPASSDPATTAMISFNELMEILWIMFQVKWEYDPVANNFIIEHISDWGMAAGLDLTTQQIAKNNRYTYEKELMPKYEKFSFMESDNANFVGVPIWYDSECVNPDPDSNVLEKRINVTTDLHYIAENVEAISDEGFVILCNYEDGGNYYVEFGAGALNGQGRLNMYLSWANLQNSYYRHNRVLISGYLNNLLTDFWTAQKVKLQECFAIVCPDDAYDPSNYITTELGETWFGGEKAKVKRSELNPNGEMKFSLLYGPADNVNTGVADTKTIFIKQTGDDTFEATLTEPADVGDLTLELYAIIYDDVGAEVCTGAGSPETWTIEAGNRSDSFTLTLCDPIPLGGCMELMLDSSGAPGWFIDFEHDYTKYCVT